MHIGRGDDNRTARFPWIPIIGLLLSVAVVFFTLAYGLVAPGTSAVLGLLTLLLTLELEQIVRTQHAVETARNQAILWQKLEQAPWMRVTMKEIIDCAAVIDAMPDNKVFAKLATEELEGCQDNIRELARGRIRIPPDRFQEVVMPLAEKVGVVSAEDTVGLFAEES